MVDWRAIGYGIGVFPVVLLAAISEEGWLVLVTGFPSGLVAGYRAGGLLNGLLYGFVAGCGILLLFFGAGYYLVVSSVTGLASPGIGLTILGVLLIAALLAVESSIAGAIGGLLNR